VFGGRAHGVFSAGGEFHGDGLTANNDLRVDLKKCGIQSSTFSNLSDLGAKLRLKPRSQTFNREMCGVYLQPTYSNLGAIDSLAITVDHHNKPRAIFFQITIALNHPLSATQLRAVWDVLPNEVRKAPPAIVLVVPLILKSKYKVQRIDGADQTADGPNHWPQFVIGLGDERLWGVEG
jgi:hypothetical protein